MKKTKISILLIAVVLIGISAFVGHQKAGKNYGLIYSCYLDKSKCHYVLIDLAILDSLNADYSCEIGGYHCEVSINSNKLNSLKRKGAYNEIIEFDANSNTVEVSGPEGFHFVYDINIK